MTAGILTAGASTPAMGFLYAVLGGAAAGGVATGSLKGVLWGAVSGAVFFGIGQGFQLTADGLNGNFLSTGLSKLEFAAQGLSHGVAGGLIAELQGGKFGHGFASSGIAKLMTPFIGAKIDDVYAQGAAVAIVGGTTSEITGGMFGNGAVTAAMAFAFNQVASNTETEGVPVTEEEQAMLDDGNIEGFYQSRLSRGDGYASTALGVVQNNTDLGRAANAQLLLEVYIQVIDGKIALPSQTPEEFLRMVNLELAKAHVEAVNSDVINFNAGRAQGGTVPGLLSETQVQRYHETYFMRIGLPKDTFGGATFGINNNAVFNWCRGCDPLP